MNEVRTMTISVEEYLTFKRKAFVLERIMKHAEKGSLYIPSDEIEFYKEFLKDDVDRQPGEGHGEVSEQESSSADL